ncbi:MAG: class I SAM-dependent methyltransferase [Bacteroidota bacterium]
MKYKLVDELVSYITNENPFQKKFLIQSFNDIDTNHLDSLNEYLKFCISNGIELSFIAKSYNFIVKETFKEQIFFNKHKRYRYSSYREVAGSVYMDPEYMKKYMYGLAITAFLWKQHQLMHVFFEKVLPNNKKGSFLEIGSGHGYYFLKALTKTSFDDFTAIDISPTSVEMTKAIVTKSIDPSLNKKWNIYECDFLKMETNKIYDGLVMGEVLEHVENPYAFLRKIYDLVNSESFVYITTCANAPEIDHLYLFKNASEVIELVQSAGFAIVEKLIVPYSNFTLEETIEKELPLNIALTLKKNEQV